MSKKIYLSPSDQFRNLYAYGNTNEMVQCQKISDACEVALKRCGFDVINNKVDEMEDRIAESNEWGADLHVPIHTNAFNGKVSGTRIMVYNMSGVSFNIAQAIFQSLAPITPGTSENISAYPGLSELRHTKAPAVYVEADFHDVPDVAKWIIEHTEEIGEAIAKGICNYFGCKYVEPEEKPVEPVTPTAPAKPIYRVFNADGKQVGAYVVEANAFNEVKRQLQSGGAAKITLS